MRLTIQSKNKKTTLEAKSCNFLQRFSGLMFHRRESAEILLFEFGKKTNVSIHSFFVFFPFIAVWLDDKNRILEIQKVNPFQIKVSAKNTFNKIIEIPLNEKSAEIIKQLNFPSTRKI